MSVDDIRAAIRTAIIASEESMHRIALNAGIAPNTLIRFVNGNRGMTIDTLKMVLDALGMEMTIVNKMQGLDAFDARQAEDTEYILRENFTPNVEQ